MGDGENISKEVNAFVSHVVFVCVAIFAIFLVALWSALLLSFAGFTTWPEKPTVTTLTLAFGISLSILLAVLWICGSVSVIALSSEAQSTIRKYLIVSILGSVAGGIAAALK